MQTPDTVEGGKTEIAVLDRMKIGFENRIDLCNGNRPKKSFLERAVPPAAAWETIRQSPVQFPRLPTQPTAFA